MKQKLLQKTLLLLFALIAGSTSVWADDSYTQVTDVDDLDTDATYIIGDITSGTARAFGALNSGNRGTIISSGLSASGSTIIVLSSAENKPLEFSLTKSGDYYLISYGATATYLTYSSGTAFVPTTTKPTTNGGKWNIAYNDTYSCLLINNVATTGRYILRNGTSAYGPYSSSNLSSYGKATLYKKVANSKTVAGLAYADASQTVNVGETLSAPTLTNPHSLSVTYESADENVATVDASGNVTGVKIGSTTITATFDGDDDYLPGSASYTINVTRAVPVGELFYESVSGYTSDSDATGELEPSSPNLDSDKWNTLSKVYAGANGHLKFGSSSAVGSAVTKGIALTGNGKLTYKVQRFNESNSGELTVSVTGATAVGDVNVTGTADWVEKTVYLIGGTGNVVITFATKSTGKRIRVDDIQVLEGNTTVPVTITTADYATFCSAVDLDFSETGITVYQAKVESNKVKFTEVSDGLVKAGEGVLLYKDVDAETVVNVPVTTGVAALSENELVGVTTETAVAYNPTSGVYNYILQMDGANLVFRKATGDKLRANRAYLSTSYDVTAPGARELEVSFGDETAINALENSNKVNDGAIYDLSGRRVENPTKGIYIMNGKKVVIK